MYLNSSMRAEVEIKFIGMSDPHIHCGPSRNVATATNLNNNKQQ